MKNMLAVAFVVSVASIALSQNPNPPAPAAAAQADPGAIPGRAVPVPFAVPVTKQQWEYKVSDRGGFEPGAWEKKLNELAKEGWELDAIDEGNYILRRSVVGLRTAVIRAP